MVVSAALRDEGTSFHHLPPGRRIEADSAARRMLEEVLTSRGAPYVAGLAWTTDARYRETPAKIAARREEGCLTVEMEASALMAIARFRGVPPPTSGRSSSTSPAAPPWRLHHPIVMSQDIGDRSASGHRTHFEACWW